MVPGRRHARGDRAPAHARVRAAQPAPDARARVAPRDRARAQAGEGAGRARQPVEDALPRRGEPRPAPAVVVGAAVPRVDRHGRARAARPRLPAQGTGRARLGQQPARHAARRRAARLRLDRAALRTLPGRGRARPDRAGVRGRGAGRRPRARVRAVRCLGALRHAPAGDGAAQPHQQRHPLYAARPGAGRLPAAPRPARDPGPRHRHRHRRRAPRGDLRRLLSGAGRRPRAHGRHRPRAVDRRADRDAAVARAHRALDAGPRLARLLIDELLAKA